MKKIKLFGVLTIFLILLYNYSNAQDLTSGLIAVYEFEDLNGSVTLKDSKGGNDGSCNNLTFNQTGKLSNCALYNYSSDILAPISISGYNQLTLSVWMKTTSTMAYSGLYYFRDTNPVGLAISATGTARFDFYINGLTVIKNIQGTRAILDGSWHLITGTFNGSLAILYVDGAVEGTIEIVGNIPTSVQGHIGRDTHDSRYFSGYLDQTAIWNRALTAAEVTQLYNSGQGLPYTSWGTTTNPLQPGTISASTPTTINYGVLPGTINGTDASDGNCGGNYVYQWQVSYNGSPFSNISSNGTGQSYAPVTGLTTNTRFKRLVTCGTTVESNILQFTVAVQVGAISPVTETIDYNGSPGEISVIQPKGGSGSYFYQWESFKIASNISEDVSGANTIKYTPLGLTESTKYRLRVECSDGQVAWSDWATITVNEAGGTTGEVQNLSLHVDTLRLSNSSQVVVLPWKKYDDKVSTDKPVFVGDTSSVLEDKLFVNGRVKANEITVEADQWSDFVFDADYNLKPLNEVESFIKANKHLPDVPSETAVNENGVRLGQMNAILLQKIEELTLYILEQEKRIQTLENNQKGKK